MSCAVHESRGPCPSAEKVSQVDAFPWRTPSYELFATPRCFQPLVFATFAAPSVESWNGSPQDWRGSWDALHCRDHVHCLFCASSIRKEAVLEGRISFQEVVQSLRCFSGAFPEIPCLQILAHSSFSTTVDVILH